MSQLGEDVKPDHTYSKGWSQEYPSQQEIRYPHEYGSYSSNSEESRELYVTETDKGTQTESLLSEDWEEPENSESDIEIEEHKVCAIDNIVSHVEKVEGQDNTKDFVIKNENKVALQGSYMPPGRFLYQDRIQPCYIKDEIAPQISYMSPGCEMQYSCQNNYLFQPPNCPCGKRHTRENCDELGIRFAWREARRQMNAEVQVDSFESGLPVKCMTCGTIIQDRNSCQERILLHLYECKACVAQGITGPVVTSYLESTVGHNTGANTRTVPCDYCRKMFGTVRGMRIHMGRIHKGSKAQR